MASLPSTPALRQEVVRLLKHLWVTVDAMADVDGSVTFRDMKPCQGGVLHVIEWEETWWLY